MKLKILNYSLIAIVFIFVSSYSSSNDNSKYEVLTNTVINLLNMRHYSPPQINDSLSSSIFNQYLKKIDFGKRFFTYDDIKSLEKKYRYSIDDELKSSSYNFFNDTYNLLEERLAETKEFYSELLAEPFDYSIKETVEMDPLKLDYQQGLNGRKEAWRKLLKYETLTRIVDQLDIQEKALENKDTLVTIKTFTEIEVEEREKVKKRYEDFFTRVSRFSKDDRFNDFVNSFTEIYDPHTQYFPPKEKEDFDINMSGSLEGIGAQLSQRDDYIRVERVIPGSPAWKNGQLKEGDMILKVAQAEGEPVDVVGMRLDDAVRLVRGKKGTEVKLSVKKVDGSTIVISIIRDVIQLEDTFAKSAILNRGGNSRRFGYIKLPSFYADFADRNGRRSSLDMKQELIKLKNENINGLILDLRNNGGGSLDDVIDIAGLFINKGPIVQVNSRYGAPQIREDFDPAIYYEGPLVILVNSVSASASEILAAAMQDYKRAIVIGGSHTFGKGTVQAMLDLDPGINPRFNSLKPFGAMKLTIQKFYRINGGSTQVDGVIPDIILPDTYTHSDIGEKSLDYALPWTKIAAANYQPLNVTPDYYARLVEASKARVKSDEYFTGIDSRAAKLKELREQTLMPLNYDEFIADKKMRDDFAETYSDLGKEELDIAIAVLKADKAMNEEDTAAKDRTEAWHTSIKKDNVIKEAMNVLLDMNQYLSKR